MTLGCKTNQYDSQAMLEQFVRAGYTPAAFDDICDVYVVNTCMVTGVGEKKSLKFVRQAARRNPQAAICVTGCLAQHDGEKLFLPGVRLVLAQGIALALSFKLGAEVLRTVIVREWNELMILGAIILLRAALTFLIHWEIKNEEKKQ